MPEHHHKPGAQLDEERDGWPPVLAAGPDPLPRYAELYCQSNFSFQHGAAHPQALVRRAYDLGYEALALTDECSVAGVVRALAGWDEYRALMARLDESHPQQRRSRPFRRRHRTLHGKQYRPQFLAGAGHHGR